MATDDYITVNEIARIVVDEMGLEDVTIKRAGGDRAGRTSLLCDSIWLRFIIWAGMQNLAQMRPSDCR